MASQKQIDLSEVIKSFHKKLRYDSATIGEETAWIRLCKDEDSLGQYAKAMEELATKYWENNYLPNSKAVSRVEWVNNYCLRYFYETELLYQREKEHTICQKLNLDVTINELNTPTKSTCKLKLLDVGSCYNPFKKWEHFDVVAIDIAPANAGVRKCDFLNVEIVNTPSFDCSEIKQLQANNFDVVVFSLLLEYFPSPSQRLSCCKKAYEVLKYEGILIIITPDSKHVGANAKIMKSWRHILAKMGFSRIRYEKYPHIHCMVFRKSIRKEVPQRWSVLHPQVDLFNEIVIPQDFNAIEESVENKNEDLNSQTAESLLDQLPYFEDI